MAFCNENVCEAHATPQQYLVLRATLDNIPLHSYKEPFTDEALFTVQDQCFKKQWMLIRRQGVRLRKYEVTELGKEVIKSHEKNPQHYGIANEKRFCDENMI